MGGIYGAVGCGELSEATIGVLLGWVCGLGLALVGFIVLVFLDEVAQTVILCGFLGVLFGFLGWFFAHIIWRLFLEIRFKGLDFMF